MKKGITLLECMIYLAGSAVLMMCMGYIIFPYLTFLGTLECHSHHFHELLYALSHVERFFQKAPTAHALWKHRSAQGLVWHQEPSDYGLFLEDNCLVRYEGTYHHSRWQNALKTPLLHGVQELMFDYESSNASLKGIWCRIKKGKVVLTQYNTLMQERIFVCS